MNRRSRAGGFTLASLMTGVALGMLTTIAALATFQALRAAYADVVDSVAIEERGQRALAIVAHAIRQAGWIPAQVAISPAHAAPEAPMEGRDDCGQPSVNAGVQCARTGVASSDALLVRMSGSGPEADDTLPDGTMSDCGGYALPASALAAADGAAPHHAATNLFYVGTGNDGVPQLLCRYPTRQGTRVLPDTYTSGTLIRGVETMQFRYGVDLDGDGDVDRFLSARSLHAQGASTWHRVRAVQIALVIRGERRTILADPGRTLTLLPPQDEDGDAGDQTFRPPARSQLRRRVFATTVRLRNPSPCLEALC